MIKNWNALIKRAHDTAVSHGWHDKPVALEAYWNNIHGEISEAWNEYAHNHEITEIYCGADFCEYDITCGSPAHPERCENFHPCGVPIELADVCIRIMDWMGESHRNYFVEMDTTWHHSLKSDDFPRLITHLHEVMTYDDDDISFSEILDAIDDWCEANDIDLEAAILMKMDYNEKRSYRHGGKRA